MKLPTPLPPASAPACASYRVRLITGLHLTVLACAWPSAAGAEATETVVPLEEYVVSATRSLQDPRFTPNSVSRLDLHQLEDLQIEDLRAALDREPGVDVVNTGATGGQASAFLRGAASHHTLFVVDGVRMNDRSASYLNTLGGAGLGGVDRLEVLRGPQSTLYGSSAMGGVILLETSQASSPMTRGSVQAGAGSFGTYTGGVAVAHGTGRASLTAALERYVTSNDQPHNDFERWSFASRAEGRIADSLLLGATYRGQWNTYEETGSTFFPSAGVVDSDNQLLTSYAEARWNEALVSRLTAALHLRDYRFASGWGTTEQSNKREILDLQNTWAATGRTEIVFGLNLERAKFTIDGLPSRDEMLAGYVSAIVRPSETLTLMLGGRYDDFESVGGADTWRAGLAWRLGLATKVRATVGTGFCAPGSDDRYGVPQWGQLPNPDIQPEESEGWDAGIEHEMLEGRLSGSLTWFSNRFRNLFEWETVDYTTFEGRIVNRPRASTEGVEVALRAAPHRSVSANLAYTYLEARNDSDDTRLIRRPRHALDADLTVAATRSLSVGAGVHLVADRVETFAPAEDYTTVRLFASWRATESLRLQVRVENALDETYEEVLGYPALPRGAFGGLDWSF